MKTHVADPENATDRETAERHLFDARLQAERLQREMKECEDRIACLERFLGQSG